MAARLAFAVQDVAQGRERVAGAEISFEQVALDKREAVGKAESSGGLLRDVDDFGPVDGGDVHTRGVLRLCDAPNAGTGSEVEDLHGRTGTAVIHRCRQGLGGWIAHGENVEHEIVEELATGLFNVDRRYGIARSDDLVDVQPARNELFAAVLDEPALEGRFGADEEGIALGSEGVAALLVFREELEADQ